MFDFRKVLSEDSRKMQYFSESKKKNQDNYKEKVDNFLQIANHLKVGVERRLLPYDTVLKFNDEFEDAFGPLMTMRARMLSRTSRVLNEMYKKLKKLNKNGKISENLDGIEKALKYTPKTSNGDYIKRSTIDNPKVVKYFNDIVSTLESKFANNK